MVIINVFASILIIALFLILFFRKDNAYPNKILGISLLVPAFNFLDNILILTGVIYAFPWSYFFVQITASLFAPFSYYYITLVTGNPTRKSFKWLKFVSVLIIIYGLWIMIHFAMRSPAEKTGYLNQVLNGPYPDDMAGYSSLIFIHQLIYFSFNAIDVYKFRKKSIETMSDLDSGKVSYLIQFVSILWILTFITIISYATVETPIVEYVLLPLVLMTIFLFIVFTAFQNQAVFTHQQFTEHLLNVVHPESEKHAENILQDTDEDLIPLHEIIRDIETTKRYKDSDFDIYHLSSMLEIPVYKLTYIFRKNDTSFYEVIRKIRTDKAVEMLSDKNCRFSIEGIAYEVGFKNRAALYRAFQKFVGINPSFIVKKDSN